MKNIRISDVESLSEAQNKKYDYRDAGYIVGGMHITASNKAILVLVKFKVRGSLRFLSHAEMIRVFQRACARADIKVLYSKGFNPRPKLSLPLPRSVGIETDDDLLSMHINCDPNEPAAEDYQWRIKESLSVQLPAGLELLSVIVTEAKSAPQPRLAEYVLNVQSKYLDDVLKTRIKNLLEYSRLDIGRRINMEETRNENVESRTKGIDVRPFLNSIELEYTCITVECNISPAGSIRVDEILGLLGLDYGMLSAPIRRTRIQWQISES